MACGDCEQLRRDLKLAQREIRRLKRKIRRLERKLQRIAKLCLAIQRRADKVLSRRSGVPRGFWSRIKGRDDVATLVLKILG